MFLVLIGMLIYFGLGIVLMLLVYRRMANQGRSRRGRIGAALAVGFVVWAVPFVDHTIGTVYFNYLCANEAGMKVKRTVDKVDGFMWPAQRDNPYNDPKTGYQFIEGAISRDGLVTRSTVGPNGVATVQHGVLPKSQYVFESQSVPMPLGISRGEYVVKDRFTNERLASRISFGYRGGWLFRMQAPLGYRGPSCPDKPFAPRNDFISIVLKPIHLEGS